MKNGESDRRHRGGKTAKENCNRKIAKPYGRGIMKTKEWRTSDLVFLAIMIFFIGVGAGLFVVGVVIAVMLPV